MYTDVLESSGIAWPNQFMWQRHAYTSPMPVPTYASTDINTHAHSPRRHTESEFNPSLFAMPTSRLSIVSESQELSAQGVCDRADYSFAPQSRQLHSIDETTDWMTDVDQSGRMQQNFQTTKQAARKARLSSTDESMPDYPARLEEEFMKPPAPRQSEEESLFQNPKTSFNTLVNGMNVSNVSGCDGAMFFSVHWKDYAILTGFVRFKFLHFPSQHVHSG